MRLLFCFILAITVFSCKKEEYTKSYTVTGRIFSATDSTPRRYTTFKLFQTHVRAKPDEVISLPFTTDSIGKFSVTSEFKYSWSLYVCWPQGDEDQFIQFIKSDGLFDVEGTTTIDLGNIYAQNP